MILNGKLLAHFILLIENKLHPFQGFLKLYEQRPNAITKYFYKTIVF